MLYLKSWARDWLGSGLVRFVAAIARAPSNSVYPLGPRVLLGFWLFSTLAMRFDAASLTVAPRTKWFSSRLAVGLAMLLPWGVSKMTPVVKFAVQPQQRAQ